MARQDKPKRGRPPAAKTMQQIAIRLDSDVLDRVDRLVDELSSPLVRAERSTLLRAIIDRGLDIMEQELTEPKRGARKK